MPQVEQNYLSAWCQPKKAVNWLKPRKMSSFFPKGVNTNSFLERNNKKEKAYSRDGQNQKFHLWVFVVEPAMAVLLGVMGKDAWDICVCEGVRWGPPGRVGLGLGLSEAHPAPQLLISFCADSIK